MKKYFAAGTLALMLVGGSAFAAADPNAAGSTWEVSGGPNISINLIFPGGGASEITGVSAINPSVGPSLTIGTGATAGIGYILSNGLEAVLTPGFNYLSSGGNGGASLTEFILLVGLNYSFMPDIKNSFFIEADVGLNYANAGVAGTSTSSTNFQYQARLGKRFAITDDVTYRPEIQYSGVTSSPALGDLAIVPLEFSFFL